MGLSNRVNFLGASAAHRALAGLPLEDLVARFAEPGTKRRILADLDLSLLPSAMLCDWNNIFRFDAAMSYLPARECSVARVAASRGERPEAVAYDWTLEALDWDTGESRFHWTLPHARYNTMFAPVVLDPDGRLMWGASWGRLRLQPQAAP